MDVIYDPCGLVVVVEGASDAERASVELALSLWNDVGAFGLTNGSVDDTHFLSVHFQKAAGPFYGLYDDERGVAYVNKTLVDSRARAVVVAHELGHAFGLWHVAASERLSVMNPGNTMVEPTPADAADVVAIWGSCDERITTP
jgi:hypothetical protein